MDPLNDVVRGQTAGISSMWDGDPGQTSWESELTSCRAVKTCT